MEPQKVSETLLEVNVDEKLEKKMKKHERRKKQLTGIAKEKSSNAPVPMHAMELSLIFNTSPDEKKQCWCQRSLKGNYYIKAAAPTANDPEQPGLVREEDLNTLLVCFLLLKHSRIKINKYAFETTPYHIIKLFGEFTGGSQYSMLKKSLERLAGNYITTNFWWDTINGERIIKNNFHFLSSVAEGELKSLRINLSPEIVDSLERGYVRFLTESSLKGILKLRGHAKVLALFLLKLLGYKSRQDLNLETVLKYLGVEVKYSKLPGKYFNRNVRKYIVPALGKASDAIGISCAYDKQKQQFALRRIAKAKQIEAPAEEMIEDEPIRENKGDTLLTQRRNEVFRKLANIGIHSEMIIKLFDEADIDEIERQVEWLPYRKSDNPSGILVSAIRGRWIMPAEYERERETGLKTVER